MLGKVSRQHCFFEMEIFFSPVEESSDKWTAPQMCMKKIYFSKSKML